MDNKKNAFKSFIKSKFDETEKIIKDKSNDIIQTTKIAADSAGGILRKSVDKITNTTNDAKGYVYDQLDINKDGSVDIEDIIILALRTPGVKIDRELFLNKELKLYFTQDVIEKIAKTTPMEAGVDLKTIDKIAEEVIKSERYLVSGISGALGTPGGLAMVATVPSDIVQYYGYLLRTAQKLMYLYGFPEIINDDNSSNLDSATMNTLIVAMGVMFGVANANNAIKAMAKALGVGVEKQLMKKALTKGTIYPIVKSISKWFGVRMTKEIFSGFFKKAIPLASGAISAGITYASFKPCCDNLKLSLRDTMLSNSDYIETKEVEEIYEEIIIDED